MTSPLLLSFGDPRALNVAACGGKGASLARGTQAGLPVPDGGVVTVTAYQEWEETGRPQGLPAVLEDKLRGWLAKWPDSSRFAVRSSATAEDGLQYAFAGQHETWLNVPPEEVSRRIVDCWLSLRAERAVAYRRNAGLRDEDVAMAVVVQRMIPADVAGVGFCLNPVTGNLDEYAFDASFGVGETVVSGEYPVDHYTVSRKTGEVLHQILANKDVCLVATETGTAEQAAADPGAPAVSANQIKDLVGLLDRVQTHYGYPQDVEWAFHDNTLYLLQSRPITRLPEHWTRDESAERFPNPVSRLCWEMVEEGFHQSLAYSLKLMGLPPYEGKWFARQGQHVYGNQTAVDLFGQLAKNRIPRLSPEKLDEQLAHMRREFAWVLDLPSLWARDLDTYLLNLGELQARDLSQFDLAQAYAYLQEVRRSGAEYFLPNIAISITQRSLCGLLTHLLQSVAGEEKGLQLATDLLAWCDTKTARVNQDLWELGRLILAHEPAAELLRKQGGEALLQSGLLAEAPAAQAALQALLRNHGHREWDFDPYVAPWAETPGLVLELVRGMLDRPSSPADESREARIRMQAAERLVMQYCPEPAQYFVSELIRLARAYTGLDDVEHYQTLRLNLPLRRALRAIGMILQAQGVVVDPMDVCFAGKEALGQAVANPERLPELGQQIAAEKAAFEAAHKETPAHDLSLAEAPAPGRAEGLLQGVPGSPGVVRGKVCHVRSTADFADFEQGAVLVARTTNPAWTPLFFRACAVVTESGGPLSHGAVTARELGLPAIMAVTNALAELPPGSMVEVDGRAGTVRIV